jgi:hypothetical protein
LFLLNSFPRACCDTTRSISSCCAGYTRYHRSPIAPTKHRLSRANRAWWLFVSRCFKIISYYTLIIIIKILVLSSSNHQLQSTKYYPIIITMADNNEDELVDYDEEEVRREIAADRNKTGMRIAKQQSDLSLVTPSFNSIQPNSLTLFPLNILNTLLYQLLQEVAVGDKAAAGDEAKETKK